MISMITAYDKNRAIGYENRIPWHIPADIAFFRENTLGKTVVMGRKTYESIGKALPDRENIVLSSDPSFNPSDATVYESFLRLYTYLTDNKDKEIFIIGGETLYVQLMPITQRLYVTEIDHEFKGDAFFPQINRKYFSLVSETYLPKSLPAPYPITFKLYERI